MINILNTMQNKLKIKVNSIKYYDGGVSNENYLINNKYIYRRKKSFSQPFYSPECEKDIEEFEYFVDFDEPDLTQPKLTDDDLYNN